MMPNLSLLSTEATKIWMEKVNERINEQIDKKINSQETTDFIINEIKKKITETLNNTNILQKQITTVTPPVITKKEKTVKSNSYTFNSSFDDIFNQLVTNGNKNNN